MKCPLCNQFTDNPIVIDGRNFHVCVTCYRDLAEYFRQVMLTHLPNPSTERPNPKDYKLKELT